MVKSSAARKLDETTSAADLRRPGFGGGDRPPPVRPNAPVLNNAQLGVLMLLGAEVMFFAGLIGAFLVFRLSAAVWPPPFQPRLPVGVTGVNTAILLVSAVTMHLGIRAVRVGAVATLIRQLSMTVLLGSLFLVIQGYEWIRLIHFGLTASSSVYGGLFYALIGAHGVHVLCGLIWLFVVRIQARRGRFSKIRYAGVQISGMYWTFVVALWPVLYGLVYLY
jgi:cytochrome c oxidase subunit III